MASHAIASRYANALADAVLAPESGTDPKQALAELQTFSQLIRESAQLKNVLLSPAVSNSRKRGVIQQLVQQLSVSRLVRNFLFVIVDRRRTDILAVVAQAFDEALDTRMGIARAEVKSATPLDDREQSQVRAELARVAGREVRVAYSVDPELIGGIVARLGSTVYDGSVRSQLDRLRERLVSR